MQSEQQPKFTPVRTPLAANSEHSSKANALFKHAISRSTIGHELETLLSTTKETFLWKLYQLWGWTLLQVSQLLLFKHSVWFCNPLFKHQSEGVKVGQRKTCEIRSCDMVRKFRFPWKEPCFQTHSTRWAALSALLHLRWGYFFPPKSAAHSPYPACTTFSTCFAAREQGNPSLAETATHRIVLHYLRDSQEIFNKYITHCIKINIIYKTFIVFCSSSSYSVYKCAQYRWDLQMFALIFPLNAFSHLQ